MGFGQRRISRSFWYHLTHFLFRGNHNGVRGEGVESLGVGRQGKESLREGGRSVRAGDGAAGSGVPCREDSALFSLKTSQLCHEGL